ncbi:MAG: desulfoferrodoxin Dfx [Firmicutes bacterium]|nr:desulfoferrodoxin Dfx [Bacillota bacterium]
MQIYKCKKCGTIVEEIKLGGCHPSCCGEAMTLMNALTTDGAREKHVPSYVVEGNKVSVQVGEVEHPMIAVHYIEWIAIETNKGIQRKCLNPEEAPKAEFLMVEGEELVAVYAYCNLHGLWIA